MDTTHYDTKVVRYFIISSLAWGVIAMLIGVNFNSEYIQFGRLRPLHTNGVIFGFTVNLLMATSLYIVQKTCRVPAYRYPHCCSLGHVRYFIFHDHRAPPRTSYFCR